MMCYLQRGDVCTMNGCMTLCYIELKLNASSIVSLIDASSIKFAIMKYKEFINVIDFHVFLIVIFFLTYGKVTRLLFLRHIGDLYPRGRTHDPSR